ncbi:MAG: M23 family metallopeptidase [Myxococcaceae bacterium]|jgi:hypothetical protein|nr:M23 family metallopeptidase [Myxococcaceae bacterium]MCA3014525.1 M23 family metallopeptidase [Myxococcaceae bacterium]
MWLSAVLALAAAQAPSLKSARALADDVYAGRVREAWQRAAPALRVKVGSEAGLGQLVAAARGALGREVRVVTEALVEAGGGTVYRRVSAVTHWARGMELELAFDGGGLLTGLSTRPAAREAPTVSALRKTAAALRLPVDGSWFVLWGGRTFEDNRHAPVPDMRFALDLFVVKGPGTFAGSGARNEDYWAFGQAVVAPADGVVVAAESGVPDNAPNQPRPGVLYGNVVVIDHGEGEFSLLGHLQRGSVGVKPGDRVVAGQVVGRCGNSGMSTEPHLHYQLMDDADWTRAHGLPAQFRGYLANGRFVERGEPLRGQVVSSVDVEARRALEGTRARGDPD